MTQPAKLAIVVVSYGSSELLRQNLASIDRTQLPPSMVVVVDNPTTHNERRAVAALAGRHAWDLVVPLTNVGFGAGVNRGVERALEAGCTHLLLLNPDVAIDGAAIASLLRAASHRRLTILSPRLDRPDGSVWFAGGQLDPRSGLTSSRPDPEQNGPDRWLSGACLLLDRELWTLLGGFDERYFLYWEDVDLTQRVLRLGADLRVVHEAIGVHSVGGTQAGEGKSPVYCRYMCRNRLLFATGHVGAIDRLRWLVYAPRYATRVLLRHGRAAVLRRPSLVPAVVYGTLGGAVIVVRSIITEVIDRSRPLS